MPTEPVITQAEDIAMVDAANEEEANSAAYGDFIEVGNDLSPAKRHRLRLLAAWIIAHPGG